MAVKHGTQQQRYALKGASNDTTDTADMTRPWRTFRELVERGAPQPGVLAVGCQHVVELRTRSCARSPRAPHVLSAQRQAFCSRRPAQWRQDIHLHEKTPCEPRSAATPTPTALAAAHTWHKVFAAGERTKLRRATHAQHCMQLPALARRRAHQGPAGGVRAGERPLQHVQVHGLVLGDRRVGAQPEVDHDLGGAPRAIQRAAPRAVSRGCGGLSHKFKTASQAA